MHIGICMSSIDHDRYNRSQARELALELSRQEGLTGIELVLEGIGRRFAPYPWEWEDSELEEVKEFLSHFERKGAHLPFYSMNVISVNTRVREDAMDQMLSAIDIAKQLNLDYAVVHGTGSTDGLAVDREQGRMFKALHRMAEACVDSSLVLSLENAQNLHFIEPCLEMIESLKAKDLPLAMTFDTGHSNLTHGENAKPYAPFGTAADAIEHCFPHINNIHLHNNNGVSDQHMGVMDGTLDLESCVKRLRDLDYQGGISLEAGTHVKDLAGQFKLVKQWAMK